jgi:hypothetical protein
MFRAAKRWTLAILLVLVPVTVVCDVPDFDGVFRAFDYDVYYDGYCCDYYYDEYYHDDDCRFGCDDEWFFDFDWWW